MLFKCSYTSLGRNGIYFLALRRSCPYQCHFPVISCSQVPFPQQVSPYHTSYMKEMMGFRDGNIGDGLDKGLQEKKSNKRLVELQFTDAQTTHILTVSSLLGETPQWWNPSSSANTAAQGLAIPNHQCLQSLFSHNLNITAQAWCSVCSFTENRYKVSIRNKS